MFYRTNNIGNFLFSRKIILSFLFVRGICIIIYTEKLRYSQQSDKLVSIYFVSKVEHLHGSNQGVSVHMNRTEASGAISNLCRGFKMYSATSGFWVLITASYIHSCRTFTSFFMCSHVGFIIFQCE